MYFKLKCIKTKKISSRQVIAMQVLITGLTQGMDKEFNVISNVIDKGYEKYKKDSIPLIIKIGDENSEIASSDVNDGQIMEFGSNANSRFGNVSSNRTLDSSAFTIADTFISLDEIDCACRELLIADENKSLVASKLYGIDNLDEYNHKSIKIYKSILINYGSKYKKSLVLSLSRALGYIIAKDLVLGKYMIGEDDNITRCSDLACRTAIMIIASYYSWQMLKDSGSSHRIRNRSDLDESAKLALQMFIVGGFEKEDIEQGAVTKHLYLICNYITLHYVLTGEKLDIKAMYRKGSVDYEKLNAASRSSMFKNMKQYGKAFELMIDEKLTEALPDLENIVDVCVNLIEKCKVCTKLENSDIEPIEQIIKDTEYQLTKYFGKERFKQICREFSENTEETKDTAIKEIRVPADNKDIAKIISSLASMNPSLPINVINSRLQRKMGSSGKRKK